jgi:hypothetical protein
LRAVAPEDVNIELNKSDVERYSWGKGFTLKNAHINPDGKSFEIRYSKFRYLLTKSTCIGLSMGLFVLGTSQLFLGSIYVRFGFGLEKASGFSAPNCMNDTEMILMGMIFLLCSLGNIWMGYVYRIAFRMRRESILVTQDGLTHIAGEDMVQYYCWEDFQSIELPHWNGKKIVFENGIVPIDTLCWFTNDWEPVLRFVGIDPAGKILESRIAGFLRKRFRR